MEQELEQSDFISVSLSSPITSRTLLYLSLLKTEGEILQWKPLFFRQICKGEVQIPVLATFDCCVFFSDWLFMGKKQHISPTHGEKKIIPSNFCYLHLNALNLHLSCLISLKRGMVKLASKKLLQLLWEDLKALDLALPSPKPVDLLPQVQNFDRDRLYLIVTSQMWVQTGRYYGEAMNSQRVKI